MKTRKVIRGKKRKSKLDSQSLNNGIFENSYIEYNYNKTSIEILKKSYMKSKNNIVVSKNFNLVYFEDDYFEDIQKYLTSNIEAKASVC